MERKVTIIGAGKTGRGYIARLLKQNDVDVFFVDKAKELVNKINKEKSYEVKFFHDTKPKISISPLAAYHTEDEEMPENICGSDIIFVSVGGHNLLNVSETLYKILKQKKHDAKNNICNIITGENAINPAKKLKDEILEYCSEQEKEYIENYIGFSQATIFCSTIENTNSSLDILSEDYSTLQYDCETIKEPLLKFPFMSPIKNFDNFITRKIFTYNSASAIIAYLGYLKNYTIYSDAANDKDIEEILNTFYQKIGIAICKEYGYNEDDQEIFALQSLKKFQDTVIVDSIERNCKTVIRKLQPDDRLIGPAKLMVKYEQSCDSVAIAVAAALLYDEPSEQEFIKIKKEKGVTYILNNICKVDENSKLGKTILYYYEELKSIPDSKSFKKLFDA